MLEYIKDKDSTIKSLVEGLNERALESPQKVIEDLYVFLLKVRRE